MQPRHFFAALVALTAALAAPNAPAQSIRGVTSPEVDALGALHEVNQFEMRLGAVAEQRGESPTVRRFGKLLQRDYRLSEDDVSRATGHFGFAHAPPPPPDRAADDRSLLEQIRGARGAELDQRLLATTIDVESGAARKLRDLRPRVSQKDVRRLIDRTLPIVDQHIDIARHLQRKP